MMSMSCTAIFRETGNNNIRLKLSNHPHGIRKYFFFIPYPERFFRSFGKAKVKRAGEELLGAVYSPGSQQFLRADQSQFYSLLISYQVLSAITPGERKITGPV